MLSLWDTILSYFRPPANAILSDSKNAAQIKTTRSIVTGGDGIAFMTAIKGTNYFRNSLK
jgi:hypothetical protein